ncbi:MAG: peptide deformylase [Clostridia bacterium]|jgi:peptide deformylase|nr:peptide deformylase [Clostridia bacterium]MDO4836449.1 peptide deformylase [Clostridia bacterium]
MAIRIIRKNEDPALYKTCKEVKKFDARLSELIDDMIETMNDAEGVGLAAPQVGVLRRVCVIDVGEGPVEMVNPVILESSGEQGGMEGCLSFPGESGYVVRPNRVRVEAYDRHGDLYEYEGEGLFARAVFHETDHLDGKVYKRLITEPPADFKE